jgi:16S rRNA (guanine527-N7)-methyltransferase
LSRNDEDRIVERHLLESVAPARWLASFGYRRWIDFGSGAGLPAIPLAVAGVSGAWCLVEVRRIKALFIRKAIHAIGLCDFTVANERLEHLSRDPALRGTFDAFTSRATMRLGPTLALAAPLVGLGGSAFLWKGSGRAREMEADRAWQRSWTLAGAQAVGIVPLSVCRFSRISTG